MVVDTDSVRRLVPSATLPGKPAAAHMPAMELAMADRKMSPTSCTCVHTGGVLQLCDVPSNCRGHRDARTRAGCAPGRRRTAASRAGRTRAGAARRKGKTSCRARRAGGRRSVPAQGTAVSVGRLSSHCSGAVRVQELACRRHAPQRTTCLEHNGCERNERWQAHGTCGSRGGAERSREGGC